MKSRFRFKHRLDKLDADGEIVEHLAGIEGVQFEILVDGKPRSYRDIKAVAIASAEFLKSRNPNSNIAVKDLQTGEVTPVAFRPQRA
jgi:hypothetical protein